MILLEGKNVAKVYENDRGLKEASFMLQAGRILALVGGNGAGKSTLIRLLTGQEKQQAGEIIWHQPQTIRFMPDDVNFPTMLTAAEILELLASLKKVDKYEQQNVLKRVSLWDVRKQRAKHFSKGMLQRLNLAQSLLGSGSLLILDEPTNGLDPFWIAQLKNMMLEEKEKGNTVIFSTHLLSFAEEIADDVLVLHEGKIILSGAITEIFLQENSASLEEIWLKRLKL
ncbi:ABC transporter ATP-binding protein [Lysinibacillus boronitolerans]|uniref:ABC transporter ATPase n=1 Tax=Lysinibacillus boronitolerans JCM 21713 = 10a = NBRC 103108 TaxID=1294264 RepID=A0ABR4Y3R3_9BACI|nr:ABC transporter ATP-binding protein [Lysinibacillus boronitolerans]KGR88169.1 ABC transporter ATPase [Lysinibacillus boronitolerans JCM 21713 = 10a = NBRC 103108]